MNNYIIIIAYFPKRVPVVGYYELTSLPGSADHGQEKVRNLAQTLPHVTFNECKTILGCAREAGEAYKIRKARRYRKTSRDRILTEH